MAEAIAVRPPASGSPHALEAHLRASLRDARGNVEIRRRLEQLARDPERLDALRRELGRGHALLRELAGLAAIRRPARPASSPPHPWAASPRDPSS